MDVEMESSPSYFDPEDLTIREQYRRYGKRTSTSGMSPTEHSPTNAALLLENIKQEVDVDYSEETLAWKHSASKRPYSVDAYGFRGDDVGFGTVARSGSHALKVCKIEDDISADNTDTTFALFASLLDSAIQGLMPISGLILQFERTCRGVSKSIRYEQNIQHRVVEDKLMRHKAQFLLEEAATWSLLWFLYGKVTEEPPDELILSPSTSHLEACQFVANDHTAQLCLRIVQWLEGLASKALDLEREVRGSHVGTYLHNSGIWHQTQRLLRKSALMKNTVQHLDFDAPTREHAHQLPDDKKQDESLLEDVWILIRAGRLMEACDLCRSAGQPWRAATLSPFGGMDLFPSVEALQRNGKSRKLQAIELDSGIGHQYRLWKWACYCASEKVAEQDGGKYEIAVYAAQCSNLKHMLPTCTDWESACWALAKSWLDVQVDLELAGSKPGRLDQSNYGDGIEGIPGGTENGSGSLSQPENWPLHVMSQQPRDLASLLQKLHSSEMVHEAVTRECKQQQRQIEMNLMLGHIPHLLELIWSWVAPSDDDQSISRPYGDSQMMRFGAHLVLALRYLLAEEMKDSFKEKLMTIGDRILHVYTMFLFSRQHEELVGIYASQLASHRCIDLFVHMMEQRLNSSVHAKYKIFLSAMEYLPFSPGDHSKGSFEEIVERVLTRSREIKPGKHDSSDVAEQHRLQSLQKALVIQWLCFTPPSTIKNVAEVSNKLLMQALMHSNILFREFALISMWRVPAMPVGAHKLLSFLAEPLKQLSETPDSYEDYISQNLKEFHDWSEYYSCDATYRNWLVIEIENAEVSSTELSIEEKQRAILAAKEMLNLSMTLLLRKENPWLLSAEDSALESAEPLFLELHATAVLCLPSGECMCPDATVCAALMSALYSSVTEEVVLNRQLMVNVSISSRDSYCLEIVLRCSAVEGDGLGLDIMKDGGLLATVMAAGFKGELVRFQAGVTVEISRLDAWYSNREGNLEGPATYIVRGLCRRCCIPEVILRCMQVSISLVGSGVPPETHDDLIELVSSPETGFHQLFSQQQLQEFLLFEREYALCKMEVEEEESSLIA